MSDVFSGEDAQQLLRDKNIIFIGGSNIRALYKDLVWFLQFQSLVPQELLKKKLEDSFAGDEKIRGDRLHRGRDYVEDRSYLHNMEDFSILVEYSFTSICYSEKVIELFNNIKNGHIDPDIIVMNSTLWDINRWGPDGIKMFKSNLVKLMQLVSASIQQKCMFLWLTAPPVLSSIRSSLLPTEISFLKPYVRFNVLEANNFARQIVGLYGHDVLDIHHYLRMQLYHIINDGIHYQPVIDRYVTNLILTHCSLSWNVPLPGNVWNISLEKAVDLPFKQQDHDVEKYIDVNLILEELENTAPNKQLPSAPASNLSVAVSSAPAQPSSAPIQPSSAQAQPSDQIQNVLATTSVTTGEVKSAPCSSSKVKEKRKRKKAKGAKPIPKPSVAQGASATAAASTKVGPAKAGQAKRVLVNSAKKKIIKKKRTPKKGAFAKQGLPPTPAGTHTGTLPVVRKGPLLPTPLLQSTESPPGIIGNVSAEHNSEFPGRNSQMSDFPVEFPQEEQPPSILSTKFQSWKKTKCWRGGKKRVVPYVFPRGNSILGRIRFQNPRQQAPSVRFQNRTYVRPGYQPWRPRQPQEPFYLDPTWN
ncbi:unnamed protein product [Bemisia tabaci]|uniref:Uncharacterized protein n=1 Tax=Bemisia tabaci TaxID=7038 RepID=A0A9P0C6P5_BEMTA|nr:unnamed protein product [Bemisia tabaci]